MAFVLFNLAAVAALVGIDQLIKLWAVQVLQPVGAMPLIPHVVELRFVLNQGMAFSLLSGRQLFLILTTTAALLLVAPRELRMLSAILNAVVHLPYIMIQRYNRFRLLRCRNRLRRQQQRASGISVGEQTAAC